MAFVEVANPPVNALGLSLRTQLHLELQRASSAREVDAIVLTGAGRLFMSGADISELDQPIEPPGLLDLEAQISRLPMPVIAAMHGPVLGGGLLLALMCDYRVAHVGATFGFPEVKLGLLPTFGGTQIFPRLVGIERASDLITSGRSISAEQARACVPRVARSEPASGSENSWHQISSPLIAGGTWRVLTASDPIATSVGTHM
ncbi:MAG: enoyl-CoA hydratase/isomerase family protein, partial [Alphaproteobacteria bacterium]